MDKVPLLYATLNERLQNIPQEHTLDVSHFDKEAFYEKGKIQGTQNREELYRLMSEFGDKRFIERRTIHGLYEVLEHNDHEKKVFFYVIKHLVDVLDARSCEDYYHSTEYPMIPKGALVLNVDRGYENGGLITYKLPDQNTCYTTKEYEPVHWWQPCTRLLPEKTSDEKIEELLKIFRT